MIVPVRRWSASTRATCAARSVRNSGGQAITRPSSFFVLPGSSRIVPTSRSSCRRSSAVTSFKRHPNM
jgi:hypothetical protein